MIGWNNGGLEQVGTGENESTIFLRDDGKHLRGWCRGGICWPWPRIVGARTEIVGAAVAVLVDTKGVAHTAGWGQCAAIGPTLGNDGVIERVGLSGLVKYAVMLDNCYRWATWSRSTEVYYDAVRVLRRHVGEIARLMRFWPVDTIPDVPEQVDAIIAGWAEEGRLDVHPDLADEIEKEDSGRDGIRPYSEALAAALWMAGTVRPR